MELDIEQGAQTRQKNETLQNAIENKLNQNGLFVIDRIEKDQVVCENRNTQEMITLSKNDFTWNIKEGDVFEKRGDRLIQNKQEQQEIADRIEEKMKRLWKK